MIDPFKYEVDQIYNLACPGLAAALPVQPDQDHQDVGDGRDQLPRPREAREGARVPGQHLGEVYGDPPVHPQPESYWGNVNPIGTRSCYDEGKRCAETLFFDYHRENKVDIRVVRIFNTYGPRMHPDDGRVVSNFIVQALQRRGHHDLRRRLADAVVLLRRRPDRGLCALHGADRNRRAR